MWNIGEKIKVRKVKRWKHVKKGDKRLKKVKKTCFLNVKKITNPSRENLGGYIKKILQIEAKISFRFLFELWDDIYFRKTHVFYMSKKVRIPIGNVYVKFAYSYTNAATKKHCERVRKFFWKVFITFTEEDSFSRRKKRFQNIRRRLLRSEEFKRYIASHNKNVKIYNIIRNHTNIQNHPLNKSKIPV